MTPSLQRRKVFLTSKCFYWNSTTLSSRRGNLAPPQTPEMSYHESPPQMALYIGPFHTPSGRSLRYSYRVPVKSGFLRVRMIGHYRGTVSPGSFHITR
jgi:hypothetical protein